MKLRMLLMGVLLSLVSMDVLAQAPAPWLGTWKLNVAKSKFNSGPPPRSQVVKSVASGDGYVYASDTVTADGKTIHVEYFARPDGKEYPVKDAPYDLIWLKKVDDYTNQWGTKKDGKPQASGGTVYSRDGKLRTQTWTVTNAKGEKVESVAVYERQ